MSKKEEMARTALRQALNVRASQKIGAADPICVFDLAERMGVEVKLRPKKRLSGMYSKAPRPVILVSAHRPPGRRAFTCAHELGHHVFGHGTRVDEYVETIDAPWQTAPEEFLANQFAAALLMPLPAVIAAFKRRGWTPNTCNEQQAYVVAGQLGVNYGALLSQMSTSLSLLLRQRADELRRIAPKEIRRKFLGDIDSRHLLVVDDTWNTRVAADVEVGDHLLIPGGCVVESGALRKERQVGSSWVAVAIRPGTSRITLSSADWATFVRVSQYQYTGRSMFRFLEVDDGDLAA